MGCAVTHSYSETHFSMKNCRTNILSQRNCWWNGRHLLQVPCFEAKTSIHPRSPCHGLWVDKGEHLRNVAGNAGGNSVDLQWKRMTLLWASFFPPFSMSKKGDFFYLWSLSAKCCCWIGGIRPSVFKWHFHKTHCTYVLYQKGSPTLIPSFDVKICAEPLLFGLETLFRNIIILALGDGF